MGWLKPRTGGPLPRECRICNTKQMWAMSPIRLGKQNQVYDKEFNGFVVTSLDRRRSMSKFNSGLTVASFIDRNCKRTKQNVQLASDIPFLRVTIGTDVCFPNQILHLKNGSKHMENVCLDAYFYISFPDNEIETIRVYNISQGLNYQLKLLVP